MDGQAAPRLSRILSVLPALLLLFGFAAGVNFSPVATVAAAADVEGASASAREWKGTREVRDGVTYVWNPAEPLEGTVEYELREQWRLESERADGTVVFGVVENATEDEKGDLFLLDSQLCCVHRISRSGEYLGSVGRQGDGPGELRNPSRSFVAADGRIGVIDLQLGAVVFLAPTGEPRGTWRLNLDQFGYSGLSKVVPLGSGYAALLVSRMFTKDEMKSVYAVYLFSAEGEPLEQVVADRQVVARARMYDYVEEEYQALWLEDAGPAERILVSPSYRDYRLNVYSSSGRLELVIEREYAPLRRTDEEYAAEKAYREGLYRDREDIHVEISQYHRSVTNARLKTDGTIWVTSSRGWNSVPEGIVERADVFDHEGRFVHQAVMKHPISPERDLVLPLSKRYIIVEAGAEAQMVAVGAGMPSQAVGEGTPRPAIVCCEIVGPGIRDSQEEDAY